MTAEERWEYVSGYGPWVKSFRCTACGFVSDIRSPRDRCDICAAITAAVEEERARLKEAWHQNHHHSILLEDHQQVLDESVSAAVEERERELIPLVCPARGDLSHWADGCGDGDVPVRRDPQRHTKCNWWHVVSDGLAWPCPASPLHEAIHQRGPAAAEGDGGG